MGNEIIWYILIGVAYLIYSMRKGKQKKRRPGTFEQALQEMSAAAAGEIPHAETSVTHMEPQPALPVVPQIQVQMPSQFPALAAAQHPSAVQQFNVPTQPRHSEVKQPDALMPQRKNRVTTGVLDQLRDRDAARTAVIMSTVLGRPHALRGLPAAFHASR